MEAVQKVGRHPDRYHTECKGPAFFREVENIFENSDFVYMLNQAGGDRQILAKQLGISPHQLSYVTHSGEGEGCCSMAPPSCRLWTISPKIPNCTAL